jgi:hypothetical protein
MGRGAPSAPPPSSSFPLYLPQPDNGIVICGDTGDAS